MNEIEHLSIGGYAFRLEVDAAAQLRNYIGSLESYYLPQPDGLEIMDSIEERLAELLTGRQVDVVKAEDVAAVTAILGKPEAIEDSVPGLEEAPATGRNDQPQRRPLFRVVEGRSLGGRHFDVSFRQILAGIFHIRDLLSDLYRFFAYDRHCDSRDNQRR